ncbi:MAG: ELWxxDGT repeat protein [Planctomycetota bacterium]
MDSPLTALALRQPPRAAAGLLALAWLTAAPAVSQSPYLVADINPNIVPQPSGDPTDFVTIGPDVFFVADTPATGRELYRSNGLPGSTTLVLDIIPGSTGSWPRNLTVFDNTLYFTATPPGSFVLTELWKTDGTAAGTQQVTMGSGGIFSGSSPAALSAAGGFLYFTAQDPATGSEPWRTDGTAAGTVMLGDLYPGTRGASVLEFATVGGPGSRAVVFRADDGVNGLELWVTDGTPAGTRLLADLHPGSSSSGPDQLTESGGLVFFNAWDGVNGRELWVTDGTTAGTRMVADLAAGSASSVPGSITAFNGGVAFTIRSGSPVPNQLWFSDGTPAGTRRLGVMSRISSLRVDGGNLWFGASQPATGTEPWVSDGTEAGTRQVADIVPGSGSSSPSGFVPVGGGIVLFAAGDSGLFPTNTELWRSDGTALGTMLVADVQQGPAGSDPTELTYVPSAGGILFSADAGPRYGRELWFSDGSAGTYLVDDLVSVPLQTERSSPSRMVDAFGTLYFNASDGTTGLELWASDGTAAGTRLVDDQNPGSGSTNAWPVTPSGRRVFFGGYSPTAGIELFVSEGSPASTRLVLDIQPGGDSRPDQITPLGDRVVFAAYGPNGNELWISDGTAAGTNEVIDLRPGPEDADPYWLTRLGDHVYFAATDGVRPVELWSTDGTAAGTQPLQDLSAPIVHARPESLTVVGQTLFFSALDALHGEELWCTDGTTAGTRLVLDIQPGPRDSYPRDLVAVGPILFFRASGPNGTELWKSDGTAAGTVEVLDINPTGSSDPQGLVRLGGALVFTADDGVSGREPWYSDSSAANTRRIADINPLGGGADRTMVTTGSRYAWFVGDDGVFGRELWRTDGVTVERMSDLRPGLAGASIREMRLSGDRLFFQADDGVHGAELFAIDPGAVAQSIGDGCGDGVREPTLLATDPVLGAPMLVVGLQAVPGTQGVLLLGAAAPPLNIGGGCFVHFSPSTAAVVVPIAPQRLDWNVALPIPATPSLQGLAVTFQAVLGPTAAPSASM